MRSPNCPTCCATICASQSVSRMKRLSSGAGSWSTTGRHTSAAQNGLATIYSNGEGVKQDYVEAVKWYLKAAGPFYYKKGGFIIKTSKNALFMKRGRLLTKKAPGGNAPGAEHIGSPCGLPVVSLLSPCGLPVVGLCWTDGPAIIDPPPADAPITDGILAVR